MRLFKRILSSLLIFVLAFSVFLTYANHSEASLLTQAQIQLSDSRPGQAATTYTNTFMANAGASGNVKCIVVQFAANSDMTGGAPTGMDTTSAVKGTVSGTTLTNGNFTLYNGINNTPTNGYLQFEDSSSEQLQGNTYATASATTITNPTASTFYVQISTYSTLPSSHTCGGTQISSNVLAITTTNGVTTTVTVPPSITFSIAGYNSAVNGSGDTVNPIATGTSIAFGAVPGGTASSGAQLLTVSTNAANGYTIYVKDTGTMTDANNDTLRDQTGTPQAANTFDGSTSQSSFAYTADGPTVAFGNNKWAGLGNSQTQYLLAIRTAAINADPTHVEYKVEPSNVQSPGTYSTVIVYTAVPSY